MNKNILFPEVQNFINANLHADLHSLLLKKSPFPEVSMQEIVQQIKGKQVAQKKFPFLLKDGIVFPPQLNLEQASSEKTAQFKAQNLSGKKFLDLTCGFGIDAFYLSENFDEVFLVEKNSDLIETVAHNWQILERKAEFISQNLEEFLRLNKYFFDVIYLDPARRDQNKNKVFLLEDLSPNILEVQDQLLNISEKVIIKLSPLIDLKYLVSTVKNIFKIEIIAVKNDVKEVVLYLKKNSSEIIICSCVNLETDDREFSFEFSEESAAEAIFGEPEAFIYIANNAILKAGTFNLISEKFNLKKLHPNTHIYTSNEKISDFPGRILKMEIITAKEIKKKEKYNIIAKNYPLKPEEIKKKYGISDGGEAYLIFAQSKKGKLILKSV